MNENTVEILKEKLKALIEVSENMYHAEFYPAYKSYKEVIEDAKKTLEALENGAKNEQT